MHRFPFRRNLTEGRGRFSLGAPFAAGLLVLSSLAHAQSPAVRPAAGPAATPPPPAADYYVYAGAESADKIYRIRFGPGGTVVEKEIIIGEMAAEMEGPHGLAISADGKYLHMTTGHGFPDGKYWQYILGPDTLAGPGTLLGTFPASIDVTPDGRYTFSANFNLHGDMVPSSVSVVYVPNMTEVARIVTCTMPHGSRVSPDGRFQYSGCMMDDELVEIDAHAMKVSRRFSLAKGKEAPLAADGGDMLKMWMEGARRVSNGQTSDPAQVGYLAMDGHKHAMEPNSCSPTWAQPSATGAKIYVACNKSDEILEIDRDGWAVTRRFKTARGPYNLGVTPDGRYLVASIKPGSMVEIFDLATGTSVAQIPTSNRLAHGVAISSDSRYAFVTSEGVGAAPGKVDVIDIAAGAKVGTVDIGQQASGIAFWKVVPTGR
ncbi:MAG: YncE family protein [Gemmatimonadetes bacterium]|nr:YncE family protein [Gemmatimonadota bacterium]